MVASVNALITSLAVSSLFATVSVHVEPAFDVLITIEYNRTVCATGVHVVFVVKWLALAVSISAWEYNGAVASAQNVATTAKSLIVCFIGLR